MLMKVMCELCGAKIVTTFLMSTLESLVLLCVMMKSLKRMTVGGLSSRSNEYAIRKNVRKITQNQGLSLQILELDSNQSAKWVVPVVERRE